MSQDNKHPNIVNLQEIEPSTQQHGEHYQLFRKQLGAKAKGKKLGCSWVELPPGKKSWPMHYHCANEEAIFILEGAGTLRLGDKHLAVKAGDYIALLCDKDAGHQMINTSAGSLRYLCVSTMEPNEIVIYPDTNKMFVCAGSGPGGAKEDRWFTSVFRRGDAIDYWEGE
jgi:uncharacterized cupin superfamily protein